MADTFSEQDVYAEDSKVSGIKPTSTLSMMYQAYNKDSTDISLDDTPSSTPTGDVKKKGVGFGTVEVAPTPKRTIGFGEVVVALEPKQEEPCEEADSPPPPPPTNQTHEQRTFEVEDDNDDYDDIELDPVAERYFEVAEQFAEGGDKASELRGSQAMPSRSPYKPGVKMMHGAHYFPAFKNFILNGGCAHYKNTVMLNIRVNNIAELDVMDGTCKLNFFLDCAFWVPEFNTEHYSDPETIGHFAVYEPIINFPEMKEVHWLKRNVEFSKHPGARRHEVQLGQNFETAKKVVMPSRSDFLLKRNSGGKESPSTPKLKKRLDTVEHRNREKRKPSHPPRKLSKEHGGGAPATSHADEEGWEPMGDLQMKPMAREKQAKEEEAEKPVHVQKTADLWKKSIQSARTSTFRDAANKVSSASHVVDAFTANLHRSNTRRDAASGHASDIYAHWPRMWRVLISDEELEKFNAMSKAEKKKVEPTNSKPQNVPKEMKETLLALDAQREKDLAHPDEGIVYSTYEIKCLSRQTYELFDFPFDLQDVDIVVRLEAPKADPLKRHIIPCAHDKAFFCSSRVPPLTEWIISKNLDWYVEKGVGGNASLDGGKERLVASILVLRKSYYYSRHYIFILFLMTTSVFFIFTIDADQIDARSNIVFSLLLTVVAFNYSCSESIPKVPYATILEVFINTCFLSVLAVGAITFGFTFVDSNMPDMYSKTVEQYFGVALFFVWCMGNFIYWYDIFHRTEKIKSMVEEDEQIGWLKFKEKKYDDDTRARGLNSVKTEPRFTQVTNMVKRATSMADDPGVVHPKLREEVLSHA